MDLIHDELTSYSRNPKYLPAIRAAVYLANKTLNRYYELTDTSEVYRIAMGEFRLTYFSIFQMLIICIVVLHPRHKLSYFKNAGWEDDWVNTAETLVREEYKRSYERMTVEDPTRTEIQSKASSSTVCFFFFLDFRY
jgi:hypothetical protein